MGVLPTYLVDPSPLAVDAGARPVAEAVACPDAAGETVLGVGVAVSSRGAGTLAWGHAALRIVSCVDGAVRDVEYEAYRLGAWNEGLLRHEHAGEPYLAGDYLRSQRGALVWFRNERPVDAGWYRDLARENRDLWTVWLDLSPGDRAAVARAAADGYEAQRATFRAGDDLPERYVPWRRNCTAVLRDLLPSLDPGSALPFAWLRALEDAAALRVVHPSVHLWARIGPADEIPRRRTWLRRRAAVDPAAVPRTARGPWGPEAP